MPSDAEILEMAELTGYGLTALEQATAVQRNDYEIVHAAVKSCGHALHLASKRLRDDKTIVLAAVRSSSGYALRHASKDLRDDEDIVRATVEFFGHSLEYASDRLRGNEDIVCAAFASPCGLRRSLDGRSVMTFVSPRLRAEPSFLLKFLETHSSEDESLLRDLLKDTAEALAEARSQLNREVIDVESGETIYEPAPKRARTERAADEPSPRSGLALAAEAATSAKEVKTELTAQRDAERRRADDLAERNECCVCMEADAAVCFLPCRHLSTCEACAAPLESCPTCRDPIQRRIVVFRN